MEVTSRGAASSPRFMSSLTSFSTAPASATCTTRQRARQPTTSRSRATRSPRRSCCRAIDLPTSAASASSREAVLRRLLELELTTWDFVDEKQREYRKAYAEARAAKSQGRPSYYRVKLRDLGHTYVGLALEAYNRNEINGSDIAQYLEIKVNKLPQLEDEYRRSSAVEV